MNETPPETPPWMTAVIDQARAHLARYPEHTVTEIPADGDYDHRMIDMQPGMATVCTRIGPEAAAAWLSIVRPPGPNLRGQWTPHTCYEHQPFTCNDFPTTHVHHLVVGR